jgi:hypothetical protein
MVEGICRRFLLGTSTNSPYLPSPPPSSIRITVDRPWTQVRVARCALIIAVLQISKLCLHPLLHTSLSPNSSPCRCGELFPEAIHGRRLKRRPSGWACALGESCQCLDLALACQWASLLLLLSVAAAPHPLPPETAWACSQAGFLCQEPALSDCKVSVCT